MEPPKQLTYLDVDDQRLQAYKAYTSGLTYIPNLTVDRLWTYVVAHPHSDLDRGWVNLFTRPQGKCEGDKHLALKKELETCLENIQGKDISHLCRLKYYRKKKDTLPSSSKPKSPQPSKAIQAYVKAFSATFKGDHHRELLNTLDRYYDKTQACAVHNYSVSFIQSSCMGKSRITDEASKYRMSFLMNIREDTAHSGWWTYPPPDNSIRDYLCHTGKDFDTVRTAYIAFLHALFKEALVWLEENPNPTVALSRQWYDYMNIGISHDKPGFNREAFYKKVVATARALPGSTGEDLDSASGALIKYILDRPIPHDYPGKEDIEKKVQLLLVIDEAHSLAEAHVPHAGRSRLSIFKNVLKSLKKYPIFTVFLSTNANIEALTPSAEHHPSHRMSPDEQKNRLFPPLNEFVSFDLNVPQAGDAVFAQGVTLKAISSPEYVTSFGRPQWTAMFRNSESSMGENERLRSTIGLAKEKLYLFGPKSGADIFNMHLGWLAIRIMLDIDTREETSRRILSKLVESYLRFVISIPPHPGFMETGTPSEPILAEAAASLMHPPAHFMHVPGFCFNGFETLRQVLQKNLFAKGDHDKVAACLLCILAYDRAAVRRPNNIDLTYHRPVRLLDFLRALFIQDVHNQIMGATPIDNDPQRETSKIDLATAFKDAWLHFSHFSLAGDREVTQLPTLNQFFLRGTALQCWDNQMSLDIIAPLAFAATEDIVLGADDFSYFGGRIKNRQVTGYDVLHTDAFVPTATTTKRPILSILFELGEENTGPGAINTIEVVHESPPKTRCRSYDNQERHYQITVHGLDALALSEGDRETLRNILDPRTVYTDFPRGDDPDNLALLQLCKPMFKQDNASMQRWTHWGASDGSPMPRVETSMEGIEVTPVLAMDAQTESGPATKNTRKRSLSEPESSEKGKGTGKRGRGGKIGRR